MSKQETATTTTFGARVSALLGRRNREAEEVAEDRFRRLIVRDPESLSEDEIEQLVEASEHLDLMTKTGEEDMAKAIDSVRGKLDHYAILLERRSGFGESENSIKADVLGLRQVREQRLDEIKAAEEAEKLAHRELGRRKMDLTQFREITTQLERMHEAWPFVPFED